MKGVMVFKNHRQCSVLLFLVFVFGALSFSTRRNPVRYNTYSTLSASSSSASSSSSSASTNKISTSSSSSSASSSSSKIPALLELSIDELSEIVGGTGKAKNVWEALREGIDPFEENSLLSTNVRNSLCDSFGLSLMPTRIGEETVSSCGGRKHLHVLKDGLTVESVIIPHASLPRTTFCVSSQVGCDRGCVFCATGKMGLVRNLSAAEILSQLFWALNSVKKHDLQPLRNIVFMGMGDIGMNIEAVEKAFHCIVDHNRFNIAASKVTLSTVGPNPEIFDRLARLPGAMAWSLHSPVPELRTRLVPSSRKYHPVLLRDALQTALLTHKSPKRRSILIAVTLLHNLNCGESDAHALVEFLNPLRENGIKVNVDLIPYNDIGMSDLQRPTNEEIMTFKEVLWKAGYSHSVRLTRGEEENSACGMLATSRKRVSSDDVVIQL